MRTSMFFLLSLVMAVFLIAAGGVGGHMYDQLSWEAAATSGCRGTIAECTNNNGVVAGATGELEMELNEEISRRILATTNYISYGALQRNTVPCSQRGASYYNCKAGAEANPYTRSCSAITRCRS